MASSSSSLSNVVSSLVRASMGSSIPTAISDEDLDKAVMELLMKEARQKDDKYNSAAGIRAFLESEPAGVKTNKRFLSSIIKSTDEHNRAVIRSQIIAAAEAKIQREEEEREAKRRRASEAANDVRRRRERSWERRAEDEAWDAWRPEDDERTGERKRRRSSRDRHEGDDGHKRRRPRSRSPRSSRRDKDKDRERSHRSHRRHKSHSRSRSPRRDRKRKDRDDDIERGRTSRRRHSRSKSLHRSASPGGSDVRSLAQHNATVDDVLMPDDNTLASTSSKRALSPSPGPSEPPPPLAHSPPPPPPAHPSSRRPEPDSPRSRHKKKKERPPSPSGPRPPPPPPLPLIYSKMDKYFDPGYDPRLDVELPPMPSTGLLVGDHYEGWETMLELIRARREDKARAKFDSKQGKTSGGSSSMGTSSMPSALDIKYAKRGTTREWDMGKSVDS